VSDFILDTFKKIAHFAVSRAAAFCYAVAVGVAGNLVFHFVQTAAPPAPAAAVAPLDGTHDPGAGAVSVALPPEPIVASLPKPDALPVPPLGPAIEVKELPMPPSPPGPAGPIALLPAVDNSPPEKAANTPPPKPAAPGPGSGGLY
jgi:hypothetical protein